MGLRVDRVLLGARAAQQFDELETSPLAGARSIIRRVLSLKRIWLADALHGEVVRKRVIPRDLVNRHGIDNLYVEDLPSFWRLLYSLAWQDHERLLVVLEIVDHRTYSKWFPGRHR